MIKICALSQNYFSGQNKNNTPSFNANAAFDIGTSRKPANIGGTVDGKEIIQKGTPLFEGYDVTPEGMLKALALMTKISLKGQEQEENNVAFALPGAVKGGHCYPPNIINPETKKPIGAIPVDKEKFLGQFDVKNLNIKNVIFFNDGAFWGGLSLLKLAKSEDLSKLFPDGTETPYIFPGGGLGVGEIRGRKDTIEIVPREKGHLLYRGTDKSIEQVATSVPAMIGNYARALGLNDEKAQALGKIGDGKLVTQREIQLDVSNEKDNAFYEKLSDSKYAEAENATVLSLFDKKRDGNTIKLTLKDNSGNPIDDSKHKTAFVHAADKFYSGVGQVIADFVNGAKTDKAVLTGAFIGFVMKKSREVGQNPEQLIKAHMMNNLDDCGKNNLVGNSDKFLLLHVPAMDATAGGELIAQSKVGGDSAYYSIDRNILANTKV